MFVFVHIPPIFWVLLTYSRKINNLLFSTHSVPVHMYMHTGRMSQWKHSAAGLLSYFPFICCFCLPVSNWGHCCWCEAGVRVQHQVPGDECQVKHQRRGGFHHLVTRHQDEDRQESCQSAILIQRHWLRYVARCCFNVCSTADISQLNLPHGTNK